MLELKAGTLVQIKKLEIYGGWPNNQIGYIKYKDPQSSYYVITFPPSFKYRGTRKEFFYRESEFIVLGECDNPKGVDLASI